jgi:predicted ATPase/Tfp pilus assembly protein PilF
MRLVYTFLMVAGPTSFTTFGELLKHLRLRAQLTQRELSLAVGYNFAHLSRLENNQRIPDPSIIKALFIPALYLEDEPEWVARLLELAEEGRPKSESEAETRSEPFQKTANIPASFTSFLGREIEIQKIHRILSEPNARLLTLVGPPGIGKTRLAIEAGTQLAGQFLEGVIFVDLTLVRDNEQVLPVVAHALGVKESPGQFLSASILSSLRSKNLLLILDNCEQILNISSLIFEWLRTASGLKILATSREALHLSGEREFSVSPLPAEVQLALFSDRAQAVQPDFELSNEIVPVVSKICQRLDGMPLAIELAAARIKQFSAQAMIERLDRRLQWLTGGTRDGLAGPKTLRSTIDWSYELLSDEEKITWIRMAVFAGGCTPEAAETVVGKPLSLILSLSDKSLLINVPTESHSAPRFTMLETLREYAQERLVENPTEYQLTARSHADFYLKMVEAVAPELARGQSAEPLNQLEQEVENLRSAIGWALKHQPELAVRMVMGLERFWYMRGYFSESRHWQSAALAHAGVDQRSTLACQLGETLWNLGEFSVARRHLEEAVTLARAANNHNALATSLNLLGRVIKDMGSYQDALVYFEEGLALAREDDNPAVLIPLLRNLGNVNLDLGRFESALNHFEESLSIARRIGDRLGMAGALNNVGIVYISMKNYEQARSCFLEALPILQQAGYQFAAALAVVNIGRVAFAQGRLIEAQTNFETSLRLSRETGRKWSIAYALSNLGLVACEMEDWPEAERCFRESLDMAIETSAPPRALDTLGGWAVLLARTQKTEQAAKLLGLIQKHPAAEHEAIDRASLLLVDLKKALPAEVLDSALRRGAASTWEALAGELLGKLL